MPFRNPIVAGEELIIPGIRSQDWEEAQSGWRVGRDGSAQFNSLHILNNLNATNLSAERFVVGSNGIWLPDGTEVGQRLADIDTQLQDTVYPGKFIAGGDIGTSGMPGTVNKAEETQMVLLDTGKYPAAGWYRIRVRNAKMRNRNMSFPMQCYVEFRARYTTANNGATPAMPTTSSNQVGTQTGYLHHLGSGYYTTIPYEVSFYVTQAQVDDGRRDKIALSLYFDTSDTDAYLQTASGVWNISLNYETYGPYANAGLGYPQQVVEPEPPELTNYNVTFQPLWSQPYAADSANSTTWKVNFESILQGGGGWGFHTRSLVRYDETAIRALLNGLQDAKMYFTCKVKHTYYAVGTPLSIGYHIFSDPPTTWNGSYAANPNLKQSPLLQAGDTYTFDISDWINVFANSSPSTKGITFGPQSYYTNYAYVYGATETGKPTIRITGRK